MRTRGHKRTAKSVGLCIFSVVLMCVLWIVLVGGTHGHEMLVGAASVAASALFLLAVRRTSSLEADFHLVDVLKGLRVPWYIAVDLWTITTVLAKDLLGVQRAKSLYRVAGFRTNKSDPVIVARRVLATAYTTASPNMIVIGIDVAQSRMLVHQLKRAAVPPMTGELGGQP